MRKAPTPLAGTFNVKRSAIVFPDGRLLLQSAMATWLRNNYHVLVTSREVFLNQACKLSDLEIRRVVSDPIHQAFEL